MKNFQVKFDLIIDIKAESPEEALQKAQEIAQVISCPEDAGIDMDGMAVELED